MTCYCATTNPNKSFCCWKFTTFIVLRLLKHKRMLYHFNDIESLEISVHKVYPAHLKVESTQPNLTFHYLTIHTSSIIISLSNT